MKKIGIVTLYGNFNYGNRLQNYAVQEVMKRYGFDVKTLFCDKSSFSSRMKPLYNRILSAVKPECKRYVSFERFNKRYIPTDSMRTSDRLIPHSASERYDAFVVGSDQVWNPELRKAERSNYFLRFTEPEKKICIAPSIGVSEIEDKYKEEYRTYLADFKHLSCRELDGANALSALTGRECEHIIDPTLSLTREDWEAFSSPVKVDGGYVFMLFLGEVKAQLRERIEAFAKEKHLQIIELSSKESRYYASSPDEFVYLINNAEMVFTDSFHAAAFSVNLNTPFYVFERQQNDGVSNRMTSRISSLVSLFGLESRYVRGDLDNIDMHCDFEKANSILPYERRRFFSYVEKAISSVFGELEKNK